MVSIFLYDKRMSPIGPLNRPVDLAYKLNHNELNTATITMAQGDRQNAQIVPGKTFAKITDGGREIGIFRFGDVPKDEHMPKGMIEYSLKSAECTLLDDLLENWHEIGGTGILTRDVLAYLLGFQTVKRWQLGEVEFDDEYQYNFEDVTLLEAVMSLGEVIVGDYAMTFDTSTQPWTLSFTRTSDRAGDGYLVYGRNVQGITRSIDATVVTRLYGRGYGEGDNQLTIAPVNGGKDYLDAPDVEDEYDVRAGIHVDRRQTDPALLKARMAAILEMGRKPRISYEVDAIDYFKSTGQRVDDVRAGDMARVLDGVTGEVRSLRVVSEEHASAIRDPGRVTYTLSTGRADTAEALNEVLEKIGVQELYSQGATNMYSMQISDNADAGHPLKMRFYIPGNVLRINSCLVYFSRERFRTYATMAKSGGGSARTSRAGGGATVSTPASVISSAAATGGPLAGEGYASEYTEAEGKHSHGVNSHRHSMENHSHNLNAHTHPVSSGASSTGSPSPAATVANGAGNTGYSSPGTDEADEHTHRFRHWHHATVSVTIPPLEFNLSAHAHVLDIPDHVHDLEYGVYEGERADVIELLVDGEAVPQEAIGENDELDVAKYLKKDSDGKVARGVWHEIEFVPDKLTRITADLFFQVFIQSRGAGDY